jgi:type II restriction enzyme
LKSKRNAFGKKIVDGAYVSMIERLRSSDNPNLFLLTYDRNRLRVNSLLVVPKQFFVPQVIVKRKPLPATARRAGWVGCNIELNKIPSAGKIYIVQNGSVVAREKVQDAWAKMSFLRTAIPNLESRGWLLDVMRVIEHIGKREFNLEEIYSFEHQLRVLHPSNNHIKPKIRQQLQLLRDNGYLEFTHRGIYRLL